MPAYLVLLLAVLSRTLPHFFHATSWNFTSRIQGEKTTDCCGRTLTFGSFAALRITALVGVDFSSLTTALHTPIRCVMKSG